MFCWITQLLGNTDRVCDVGVVSSSFILLGTKTHEPVRLEFGWANQCSFAGLSCLFRRGWRFILSFRLLSREDCPRAGLLLLNLRKDFRSISLAAAMLRVRIGTESAIRAVVATSLGQSALPLSAARLAAATAGSPRCCSLNLNPTSGLAVGLPVRQFLHRLEDRVLFVHPWCPKGGMDKHCSHPHEGPFQGFWRTRHERRVSAAS